MGLILLFIKNFIMLEKISIGILLLCLFFEPPGTINAIFFLFFFYFDIAS